MHEEIKIKELPSTGFLRLRDVLAFIPVSQSAWYKGIQEGIYPKGVKLGVRSVAWKAEDIRELIDKLSAQRT